MPMAAQAAPQVDDFEAAREELERMIAKLREGDARPHTEVIGELREGGAEVQRRLLQGWLDRLLEQERAERPTWALPEGSRVRERERRLEMEFGRVRVRRHGITFPGETEAKFPMDSRLNLPPEIYALSLREEVADAAVESSFDRSVARVDHATAGHVPKRQAEQEVIRAATDFEAFYEARTPPANDTLSTKALQVMSSDCKGVTMRPEALRDATRKAAEAANAEAIRGDPMAERKARRADKRMAVVTAVWEQEPHVRTAQDVLERLRRDPLGRKRRPRSGKTPRPQSKRVAASLAKSNAEGVAEMFDEAQRRNPDGKRRNVVLLDGDEKQIEYVEAEAHKRQMPITIVLDLIHVIHYLWTIALLLCGGVHKEADAWVGHILVQVLTRHPLDVVASIRQTATNRRLKRADREALDKAVEYLHKNSIYIHYAHFLAEGLPIATGVIEGACRHLVQDRMGITGARWCLAVAEAVLKLRAIRTSGDWGDYWRFHLEREHARNYPHAKAA
ncbi:MAG: ISKra4 family transposase [Casimicrobiaceae bacterium]